jgi:predicted dehydrogenase
LGTGSIARKFAGQLPEAPRGELIAVGSRNRSTAAAFTDEFGGAAHGSYESLLADEAVEAVYISLPNGMHHEWTLHALAAGKHVLCEKPLASNAAQAAEMFAAADRAGRTLVEAFMYRAHPLTKQFLQIVHSGKIGRLKLIRSNFSFHREASPSDARYQADQAGGSLMDVGCYPINFARAIAGGEPTAVQVAAHRHPLGVDDYAAGVLDFGGEVMGAFTCGMTVDDDRTTFVAGDEGWASVDTPWFGQGPITLVRGEERTVIEASTTLGLYAIEAEAFADVVQDGAQPWITRDDSLGNQRVLDALRGQLGW